MRFDRSTPTGVEIAHYMRILPNTSERIEVEGLGTGMSGGYPFVNDGSTGEVIRRVGGGGVVRRRVGQLRDDHTSGHIIYKSGKSLTLTDGQRGPLYDDNVKIGEVEFSASFNPNPPYQPGGGPPITP